MAPAGCIQQFGRKVYTTSSASQTLGLLVPQGNNVGREEGRIAGGKSAPEGCICDRQKHLYRLNKAANPTLHRLRAEAVGRAYKSKRERRTGGKSALEGGICEGHKHSYRLNKAMNPTLHRRRAKNIGRAQKRRKEEVQDTSRQ